MIYNTSKLFDKQIRYASRHFFSLLIKWNDDDEKEEKKTDFGGRSTLIAS